MPAPMMCGHCSETEHRPSAGKGVEVAMVIARVVGVQV